MPAPSDFRVLQIVSSLGMGGAETWLMQLLKYWHCRGESAPQIDFLITSGRRAIFDDDAKALGARVFYIQYSRSRAVTFARRFRRLLNDGHYAAIHDHQDYSSGWRFLMGMGLLPPVRVTHLHGPTVTKIHGTTTQRIIAQIGKTLLAPYATFIASTSLQLIHYTGIDTRIWRHIPRDAVYCGVDIGRFALHPLKARVALREEFVWPADSKIILFAGRTDKAPDICNPMNTKNSALAAAIGIEVAKRDPRVHMLFAGERSTGVPILERRVADGGLGSRIKFVGVRKDIEALMLGSDVLLFPSKFEGLGMVAVEAQAAGLPVVASTAVPNEAIVIPEIFTYVELDAPIEAWAEAVLAALNRERSDTQACKAQIERSQFSIANSAKRLESIYRGET